MIRILLVDDHRLVRAALRREIEQHTGLEVAGEASSGEAALEMLRAERPDVVVMDIAMPGIGGLEATRRMHAAAPDTRILVVSAYTDDPFPARLLQAGASGFLSKDSEPAQVVEAIRHVVDGGMFLDDGIAGRVARGAISGNGMDGLLDGLSGRELQVLTMVTQGLATRDIATALGISVKTVATYRYRLYEKLEVGNDVELARLAMRHGIDPEPGN